MERDRTSHGTKRSAEDGLEGEQRLSKRFNLLNLEHSGKLFIPVDQGHNAPDVACQPNEHQASTQGEDVRYRHEDDDVMQVEDTRDRVYIHNLDDELKSSEPELPTENRLVFLPDIERQLAKIPEHILRGDRETPKHLANELILYSVPRSITVSEDKDSVRKAIIESRARARREAQERADAMEHASQDAMLHDEDDNDGNEHTRETQYRDDNDNLDAMDTE